MAEKVIIITGASSGIGWATAKEFFKQGYHVALAARSLGEQHKNWFLKQTNAQNRFILVKTDVRSEEDCKHLIDTTVEQFGRIDVLVNNAGISMRALLEDVDLKVIKQLMDVNFWGTVYCTKFALPYLLKSKGSVVGVSSIAGFKGLPARVGYSSSKFAMHGFLEVLRTENLKNDLHVMLLAPGFTASNIRNTALLEDGSFQGQSPREEGKMMTAEEVARHLYKGVLKRKRQVVLTTEGKLAVLLSKFFSKFVDKMVYNKLAKEPDSPFKK